MIRRALIIAKFILISLVLFINILINQIEVVNTNIASANIDNGFMILLIIGFYVGGYKLYTEEEKL